MKIRVVKIFGIKIIQEEARKFFLGTAFFIDRNILLTAKHVIMYDGEEDYDSLYITCVPNNGTETIEIIKKCEKRDIAILKIKANFKDIPQVLFSNDINVGDNVEIHGYDEEEDSLKEIKTTISGRNGKDNICELIGFVSRGYSGSPIVIDGHIVCGIAYERDKEANSTFVIPISEACIEDIKKYYIEENKASWWSSLNIGNKIGVMGIVVATISNLPWDKIPTFFDSNETIPLPKDRLPFVSSESLLDENALSIKKISIINNEYLVVFNKNRIKFSKKDEANDFIKTLIDNDE